MNLNLLKYLAVAACASTALSACGGEEENTGGSDTGMSDTAGDATDADPADMGGTDMGGTDMPDTETPDTETPDTTTEPIVVTGNVVGDTAWSGSVRLETLVFVESGTLTIAPGTVIEGVVGSALVISTGARIEALGTAEAPIVFTSAKAPADRVSGDFGGVVLLGSAPINVGSSNIEGMEASALSSYGGSDAAHDCGTLRYVRIEYAGSVFGTDNELNGLTVGGCGTGTDLSFIQVHKGLDDGIEFFGGTAGIRNAVVTQAGDDGFDWDEGWSGSAQFLVVQQAADDGDKGIEADNLEDNNDATPRSMPTIWNMTLIGAGDPDGGQAGIRLRRGTAGSLNNFLVYGFPKEPFRIEGTSSVTERDAGRLAFNHVMIFSNGDLGEDDAAWFPGQPGSVSDQDPMLPAPFDRANPNLVPGASSAAAGGATPGAGFDAAASY